MAFKLPLSWTLLLQRGGLALLFGALTLFWPGITRDTLFLVFGGYAFLDGVFTLAMAMAGEEEGVSPWPIALAGIASLGAGALSFYCPSLTRWGLLYLIGGWAIVRGLIELAEAIRIRWQFTGCVGLGLAGILSLVFGLVVIGSGMTEPPAAIWLLGVYVMAFGGLLLILGLRLRWLSMRNRPPSH